MAIIDQLDKTNLAPKNSTLYDPNDPIEQALSLKSDLAGKSLYTFYKPRPLSDFKTDFNNLKWNNSWPSNDVPEPITYPIERTIQGNKDTSVSSVPPDIQNWYNENSYTSFPVTSHIKLDSQRFLNFLNSSKGKLFVERQKGLQFSNNLLETNYSQFLDTSNVSSFDNLKELEGINNVQVSSTPKSGNVIQNVRIFDEQNLLKAITSGPGKVIRSGQGLTTDDQYYENTVSKQSTMSTAELETKNRLLALKQSKVINQNPIVDVTGQNGLTNLGISPNNFLIQDYPGGPGSNLGIGNTTTQRTFNTNPFLSPNLQVSSKTTSTVDGAPTQAPALTDIKSGNNFLAKSYDQIAQLAKKTDLPSMQLYDFVTEQAIDPREVIYPATTMDGDMIKFGFECVNNDSPSTGEVMQFKALLMNGITATYGASYNNFRYLGRGEEFMTYQGFSRTISFGFRVVSMTESEKDSNYDKIEKLVSQTYPDYSSGGYMRSPLVRLTIGDYFYRLPGFLESVNVTVTDQTSWDIDGSQLPFHYDIDVSFKPIPEIMPVRIC